MEGERGHMNLPAQKPLDSQQAPSLLQSILFGGEPHLQTQMSQTPSMSAMLLSTVLGSSGVSGAAGAGLRTAAAAVLTEANRGGSGSASLFGGMLGAAGAGTAFSPGHVIGARTSTPSTVVFLTAGNFVRLAFRAMRLGFHVVITVTRFLFNNPFTRPLAYAWLEAIKLLASFALGGARAFVDVAVSSVQPSIALAPCLAVSEPPDGGGRDDDVGLFT